MEGCTQTRLEKTRELADWPPAWKYLHVCCADRGPNCGMCAKCVRTQTTLDALGALRKFGQAFDVDAYYARRKKNLTWLAIQHFSPKGDILSEEVYQAMRAQIPLSVKIAACFRASMTFPHLPIHLLPAHSSSFHLRNYIVDDSVISHGMVLLVARSLILL